MKLLVAALLVATASSSKKAVAVYGHVSMAEKHPDWNMCPASIATCSFDNSLKVTHKSIKHYCTHSKGNCNCFCEATAEMQADADGSILMQQYFDMYLDKKKHAAGVANLKNLVSKYPDLSKTYKGKVVYKGKKLTQTQVQSVITFIEGVGQPGGVRNYLKKWSKNFKRVEQGRRLIEANDDDVSANDDGGASGYASANDDGGYSSGGNDDGNSSGGNDDGGNDSGGNDDGGNDDGGSGSSSGGSSSSGPQCTWEGGGKCLYTVAKTGGKCGSDAFDDGASTFWCLKSCYSTYQACKACVEAAL